jgi:hypothetical protein
MSARFRLSREMWLPSATAPASALGNTKAQPYFVDVAEAALVAKGWSREDHQAVVDG